MATRPIYYDGGKSEDPVKSPPEVVCDIEGYVFDPILGYCVDPWQSPPIGIVPTDLPCPVGYTRDIYGACVPIVADDPPIYLGPPVSTPVCLPGAVYDPVRGLCVTDTTPVDIVPVYVDPVDTSDPPGVGDPIQTVVPTGTNTNPATTTPGIFDSLYDANGKIFGFEPMYVGIAAVAVVFLLFSGGGKR